MDHHGSVKAKMANTAVAKACQDALSLGHCVTESAAKAAPTKLAYLMTSKTQ